MDITAQYLKDLTEAKSSTNQTTLHNLASSHNESVRVNVAWNTNTDPKILRHLYTTDNAVAVRMTVLSNPNMPEDVKNASFFDKKSEVRLKTVQQQTSTSEQLHRVKDDRSFQVRMAIASHHNVSEETLNHFTEDTRINVRLQVAKNPNVSHKILEKLALNDISEEVRTAVAEKTTSTELLTKIYEIFKHSKKSLRIYGIQALARNPYTSLTVLEDIALNCWNETISFKAILNLCTAEPFSDWSTDWVETYFNNTIYTKYDKASLKKLNIPKNVSTVTKIS